MMKFFGGICFVRFVIIVWFVRLILSISILSVVFCMRKGWIIGCGLNMWCLFWDCGWGILGWCFWV